jgi:hypothetical protein
MYTDEEKKKLVAKIQDYQKRSQEATKMSLVLDGAAQAIMSLLEEDEKEAQANNTPPDHTKEWNEAFPLDAIKE